MAVSKLIDALRKQYATPQAALRALGLPPNLLDGPRLACDSRDEVLGRLVSALRADSGRAKLAADSGDHSYATRWPDAARIRQEI